MSSHQHTNLGISGWDSFHYFTSDMDKALAFFSQRMGMRIIAQSSPSLETASGQRSRVLVAGNVKMVLSTPLNSDCRAARYLKRHPDGVGSVAFNVKDLNFTWKKLLERGATPTDDIFEHRTSDGRYRHFVITTAIGDVSWRFIERDNYAAFAPGMEPVTGDTTENFGAFENFDHFTINVPTLMPLILWYKHVMGFEQFWDVEFHTDDDQNRGMAGTGLKSIVMWDPESGVKFANNEPMRPQFKLSQINTFVENNMGAGIQHCAMTVPDIIKTTSALRSHGIDFQPTPGSYYDLLPTRLQRLAIHNVREDLEILRREEILVDGADNRYMLQIFMKDQATNTGLESGGPFFFEIIQRMGDKGFGAGNFRALFEAIERTELGVQS